MRVRELIEALQKKDPELAVAFPTERDGSEPHVVYQVVTTTERSIVSGKMVRCVILNPTFPQLDRSEEVEAQSSPERCRGTPRAASWGRCEKLQGHEPPCTHDPDSRLLPVRRSVPEATWARLHRLWTKAVGTNDYVKREWQALERDIIALAGGEREKRAGKEGARG
jgi:hypothetical protein